MSKQGKVYLTLTSILLAAILAAWLLCAVFLRGSPWRRETAVYCQVGDGLTVSGFVVREEAVLLCSAPEVSYTAAEGAWVGSGQIVAYGCDDAQTAARLEELRQLEERRQQLCDAWTGAAEGSVSDLLFDLSRAAEGQALSALPEISAELTPLILQDSLTGRDEDRVLARLAELDGQIDLLQAQTAQALPVAVGSAGYFSREADGLEAVLTPEALKNLTAAELTKLDEQAFLPAHTAGRLIFGQSWYFAAAVPSDKLDGHREGEQVSLRLDGRDYPVRIERIGPSESDVRLLVLSSSSGLQDLTDLREVTAQVIFRTWEGLRIPAEAVYVSEGEAGVYVVSGARAKWKEVEILWDSGTYLVVSDGGSLRAGDAVLLTDEPVSDGDVLP